MKTLKDWIVPWLYTSREYNVGILDKAMGQSRQCPADAQ